ncbi:MAG: hypothetical protein KF868_15485 [Acidobacteria bacterium]|nr:hypothetical protein [Acidobacteriota bacterium]MCW5968350.1 hypothetical protein [Blastocatellales bacterium]
MILNANLRSRAVIAAVAAAALALCLQPVRAQKNAKAAIKAEDVVERAIFAYGTRAALYTIQANGILRGLIKFVTPEGVREGRTVTKFIRKAKLSEDLMLLDLDLPGTKYMIGFDGEKMWTVNNGVAEEPSAETVAAFRRAHEHSYEALLRYKENDGKLEYFGTKQFGPNNELDLVELTLPGDVKTRYEISRRTGRVIYLDYEEKLVPDAPPVKYRLYFKDFRYIQNSLVPYEVLVYRDGEVVEERKLVEVAYSVRLESDAFKVENANKPADSTDRP